MGSVILGPVDNVGFADRKAGIDGLPYNTSDGGLLGEGYRPVGLLSKNCVGIRSDQCEHDPWV